MTLKVGLSPPVAKKRHSKRIKVKFSARNSHIQRPVAQKMLSQKNFYRHVRLVEFYLILPRKAQIIFCNKTPNPSGSLYRDLASFDKSS